MKTYIYFFLILIAVACGSEKTEKENESLPVDSEIIGLDSDQAELAGIQTGRLEKMEFSEFLTCSGNIEPTPDGLAQLTAPMGGFVKKINHYVGERVKKGEELVILENQDYIDLQEQYLMAAGNLEYQKGEFLRKESLFKENAVSEKEYLQAKSDYTSLDTRYNALETKLKLLGLDPTTIRTGGPVSEICLKSPINGYISGIYGNIGKFFDTREIIIEVVDPRNLHLHLKVFEKDISLVTEKQLVEFSTLSEPDKKYKARIFSRGRSVNKEDLTVTVHASILNMDDNLIPGLFVNAGIIITNAIYYALPVEGLVKARDANYVFMLMDNGYRRLPVQIGPEMNGYIALIKPEENIINSSIVTKGAYFVNAALEGSEEE